LVIAQLQAALPAEPRLHAPRRDSPPALRVAIADSFWQWGMWLVTIGLCLPGPWGIACTLRGAEAQAQRPASANQPAEAPRAAELSGRRTVIALALLAIAGILVLGAGMIALVMLLGRRYRRVARQPLPRVTAVDPLYYLKQKPAPANGNNQPEGAPSDGDTA
jgi:hypothetical protein